MDEQKATESTSGHTDNAAFTQPINRNDVANEKWGKYKDQDVIPLWIADMDFASPKPMLDALHVRIEHGVFGYQDSPQPALMVALLAHLQREYGWRVEPEWLVWSQGMVPMLNVVASAYLRDGGQSITMTPVYYHLFKGPDNWVQKPEDSLRVPLRYSAPSQQGAVSAESVWQIDWEAMEATVTAETKLFMLCNPHNPVGRVYNVDELKRVADFCERHDLVLCSDEIHCQLILDKSLNHTPIATLNEAVANRSITLMAPSKTFNIAGLGCAFAIIPNPDIRAKVIKARTGILPVPNVLSYTAAEAAYTDCEAWRQSLLDVLSANYAMLEACVAQHPKALLTPLEATYLAWLDVTAFGFEDPQAHFESHGLGLSPGDPFGRVQDRDFVRINFGCPEMRMQEVCKRLSNALSE